MATISTVTDRVDGEVLTAAKYNTDHGVHETNATNLNSDKVEITNYNTEHGPTGIHSPDNVRSSLNIATDDSVRFKIVTADNLEILVEAKSASGDNSIDFETGIVSSSDVYIIRFSGVIPGADAQNMLLKVKAAGAFQDGSDYAYAIRSLPASTGTITGLGNSGGTSSYLVCGTLGRGSGEVAAGEIKIYGISSTTLAKPIQSNVSLKASDAGIYSHYGGGAWNNVTSLDGFRIIMAVGTIDVGEFSLWRMGKP